MTPSKTLLYLCLSFVVGVAFESFINVPQIFVWGFLILGVTVFAASFFAKKEAATISFFILFLLLGIVRVQIFEFTIAQDPLLTLHNTRVTLEGVIIAEPDLRPNTQKLKVKIANTESVVLVTIGRYGTYHYLDTLKITGTLKTPMVTEEFNYQAYLQKEGVYSVMDYPDVEIIPQAPTYTPATFLYEKILQLKLKFSESIAMQFGPPGSYILQGMVFGNDGQMPKDLKDQFNATGLSHVTAVSGTNIVIIISMMVVFLLTLGFWRGQAFYLAVLFIVIYIILIGFPASGVRAALMGSTALLAQKLGRQNTGARVLVLAASLMLLQNPLLLRHDVGFQLSFLASLGIVYIKPLLDLLWKKPAAFARPIKILLDILSVTIAAQVITLPIIVYNFGRISLVAPLTNVLALPAVELLTILGFLVAIAGVFSFWLGFIISLPCMVLLWYFIKILELFSQPWAQITVPNLSWVWVAGYYVILAVALWHFEKYKKPDFLGY